ncbi:hypothetical protein RchiOBHm_Chr3g0494611 [Rosa chinensis]|uniref:Uncharacterized protein n=1 Tax=Rosa chinensis TaxID=74649 RepID=A0A2P6RH16_ROSCH|nr:hypothetical protein RchiOBHm_Chr5g0059101 [Rosa chinensis]PRQ45713.1 hypothetical protein RchiOBHm_Chr3g0494611 [Rosa chinensis]
MQHAPTKFGRYHCPDRENPAEILADLISVDYSSTESVYSSQKRKMLLLNHFHNIITSSVCNSDYIKGNLQEQHRVEQEE